MPGVGRAALSTRFKSECDTAGNRTRDLPRPKLTPYPLGHRRGSALVKQVLKKHKNSTYRHKYFKSEFFVIDCIQTIKEWGFEYKTCAFSWVKKNKKSDSLFWGLGYWTRANNEICLLATKGKPKRVSKAVHQVVLDKIREHSRKPDCVRDRIVDLCGDLPRIELFARQKADGWDAWGNEV